jgi:hypothetical protein
MDPSSRTPEGAPNRCPVCGHHVAMTPSEPTGDAPCPYCGSLLWFVVGDAGAIYFTQSAAVVPSATRNIEMNVAEEDRVQILAAGFESFEGTVVEVDAAAGRLTVAVEIFGRETSIEVESWQVKPVV